jgi:hypothetical protein
MLKITAFHFLNKTKECRKPNYSTLEFVIFSHTSVPNLNPLNAELHPICHLLALLGAHHILHISRLRVKHLPVDAL